MLDEKLLVEKAKEYYKKTVSFARKRFYEDGGRI